MKISNKNLITLLTIASAFGMAPLAFAANPVSLGTADNFTILAGSTITNTGSTGINGNLGLSPGTAVIGFPPGTVSGTQHVANSTAVQAKVDLTTAYNNAAGQSPVFTIPTELGGAVKTAGVYDSAAGTFGITGTLTLNAEGDPNAVFIFKTASTLITGGSSRVVLINGAQACNVFWQVGSSATLGTNSTFKGNIMALQSATLTTGANVEGRVLARNGAVTLDTNIVNKPTCATPPSPSIPAVIPPSVAPIISITKVPTPLTLSSGSGSVVYNYTVLNVGTVAMSNVIVTDNKCSAVDFISGDTNSDSKLDMNETWKYRCSMTLGETTTNTATAKGDANGFTAVDNAYATVTVGSPAHPPLIHLVKRPNLLALPLGGGAVTYSYTVTNPGTAPLSNVSVVDDKCTGLPGRVSGHPGDLNKNDLLESNESWSFTCETNLTQTTTNTGTAEGSANGLTAIDFSLATVVVASPSLPNTGFYSGDGSGVSWNVVIPSGILLALGSFYLGQKRRVI
ncbi:MAG: ice-binding family protein [bacterium]|nr:ice-binding family protein [bacterium]